MTRHAVSPKGVLLRLKVRSSNPRSSLLRKSDRRSSHPRSTHLRSSQSAVLKANILKNIFCKYRIAKSITKRMRTKSKKRGIKDYKSISIDKSLSVLDTSGQKKQKQEKRKI